MNTWDILGRIAQHRVIAIVRERETAAAQRTCQTLIDAGVGVIEVSLTTPGALEVVAGLVERHGSEIVIGVGTALTATDVRLASLAGARLVVTPVFDRETIKAARRHGMVTVVGCVSPTEMLEALTIGADAVKLFPASTWTPKDLKGLLEALPQLPVVPTGGVTSNNAPEWIAAGAAAVGMGSALTRGGPDAARDSYLALQTTLAAGIRPP